MFVHAAFTLQLCDPSLHSSLSVHVNPFPVYPGKHKGHVCRTVSGMTQCRNQCSDTPRDASSPKQDRKT